MGAPDSTEELLRLTPDERMRLLRFVCSFAWADLEVTDTEKAFVKRLVAKMPITPEEIEQVDEWLEFPPDPDSVDPTDIPPEHKQVYLAQVLNMVRADGNIGTEEVEIFALFEKLILD